MKQEKTFMRAVAAVLAAAIITVSAGGEAFARDRSQLSAEALERIDAVLQAEIDDGNRAGYVAAVVTKEGVAYKKAFGKADPFNDKPMTTDTRFRIASMTKPVISVAVMQLVDRGLVALSDPVERFIPAYANPQVAVSKNRQKDGSFETRPAKRSITIHDLLTHTAGIGYVFSMESDLDKAYLEANLLLTEGDLGERIDQIAALPLLTEPGEKWEYSYSIDVLGRIIEVVSGMELEAYLQENVFAPLRMTETEFFLNEEDFDGLAVVVEFNEQGEMIRSVGNALSSNVNDEAFGIASGGAGLVSNVDDYARFMRMLLNGGELDGARILSPATVKLMMSDHTPMEARPEPWQKTGTTFGLGGYVVLEPGYSGNVGAEGDWGWAGYWDTHFFVNAEQNIGAILLAQTQPNPYIKPSRARDLVKGVAYGAVKK
ncbi:serine hydrolase domain-containing protein [Hyphococcus sp.]|jgi:CubicO group peptidase (beta-lactamase class C family)|uniref:serine hydrolase domain-containing protein n=1 Tax=Hyphococcus sp. TaxID=2038636 RepID=UPI003D0E3B6D